MLVLSTTDQGIAWINQFRPEHQRIATQLLDSLTLVSNDDFISGLRHAIENASETAEGVVALFVEREVKCGKGGIPHRMYKEPRRKSNRRATGMGTQPVLPKHNYDLKVGSEGLIAWLLSDISKQSPERFIFHPGPDQIRKLNVRKFLVVTDIVGSGKRISKYLDSAWKTASVRSWHSLNLLKFEVLAYTGTQHGIASLRKHKTNPDISIIKTCPTIRSEFSTDESHDIEQLAIRYDPFDHDPEASLGFSGSSVLLVFAHGCPNNVPRILFQENNRKKWKPMFPKRSTSSSNTIWKSLNADGRLRKKLKLMGEARLSSGEWMKAFGDDAVKMLLVLAALRRGPRLSETISRKTGLTIPEIDLLVQHATSWEWLDDHRQLTTSGSGQLAYARKWKKKEQTLDAVVQSTYFPSSLRAPVDVSS